MINITAEELGHKFVDYESDVKPHRNVLVVLRADLGKFETMVFLVFVLTDDSRLHFLKSLSQLTGAERGTKYQIALEQKVQNTSGKTAAFN